MNNMDVQTRNLQDIASDNHSSVNMRLTPRRGLMSETNDPWNHQSTLKD